MMLLLPMITFFGFGLNKTIVKYSLKRKQLVHNWIIKDNRHKFNLECSCDDKYLFIINICGTLDIADLKEGLVLKSFHFKKNYARNVEITRNNQSAFVFDGFYFHILSLNTLEFTKEFGKINTNKINSWLITNDEKNLVMYTRDKGLKIFNMEKNEITKEITFDYAVLGIYKIDDGMNLLIYDEVLS